MGRVALNLLITVAAWAFAAHAAGVGWGGALAIGAASGMAVAWSQRLSRGAGRLDGRRLLALGVRLLPVALTALALGWARAH